MSHTSFNIFYVGRSEKGLLVFEVQGTTFIVLVLQFSRLELNV
jgi:hypothetical protein